MNKYFYFIISLFILSACELQQDISQQSSSSDNIEELHIPEGFQFATSKNIELEIGVDDHIEELIFDIYDQEHQLLLRGITSQDNIFSSNINLAAHHDSIWLKPQKVGLIAEVAIPLSTNYISYSFSKVKSSTEFSIIDNAKKRTLATNYSTIGNWDTQGRPTYLESQGDVITQDLLDDISASLPETRPVPEYNPEYLVDQDMNTKLQEEADVWITFVHEGAGWKNTLGFYTYDITNPPNSVEEINEHFIIFPNVSFNGSGGNLQSGDKVHLGRFPANTGIGWFLIPNAWDAGSASVQDRDQVKYSVKSFNNFTDATYAQHVILLKDDVRELLLLGFEDTSRPAGDNDFNDAVFYVSANPYSAIITNDFNAITTSEDTDNDGVLDHIDEYPSQSNKAFNAYLPAKNQQSSLAFEDLWPEKGDYDFNDLVVDYQYKKVLSANMKVQEIQANFTVKAIGGYFHNGFGIELPLNHNLVEGVTGNVLNSRYVVNNANGTESGHSNAVVIIFEDAYDIMSPLSSGQLVNVRQKEAYINPETLSINIDLSDSQIDNSQITTENINPFLIVDQNRGHEIHLPGRVPTALFDVSLLGSGADNSIPANNRYYVTDQELPWAININQSFAYPIENAAINRAHNNFSVWAESNGAMYTDWYYGKINYRNSRFIY